MILYSGNYHLNKGLDTGYGTAENESCHSQLPILIER